MWIKIFVKDGNGNGQKTAQVVPIRWLKVAKEDSTAAWADGPLLKLDESCENSAHEASEDEYGNDDLEENQDSSLIKDVFSGVPHAQTTESPSGSFNARLQPATSESTDCWIRVSRASGEQIPRASSEAKAGYQGNLSPASSQGDDDDVAGMTETCVVCLERSVDMQLLPCAHQQFCRTCILESICCWSRYCCTQ